MDVLKKRVYVAFASASVFVGLMGMAAFGLLMLDFQWPGLFKHWFVRQEDMAGNMVLLVVFGLQHSIMARKQVKTLLRRIWPEELERSLYVLFSGFVLLMIATLWSPTDPPLYDWRGTGWGILLHLFAASGILFLAWSATSLGGLELIGVDAIMKLVSGRKSSHELPFSTPGPYRWVRHPIYLGMLLIFWATPAMTHDHLLFAEVMTAYVLIGATLEERDLERRFGHAYRDYQRKVPMLIPFRFKRKQCCSDKD